MTSRLLTRLGICAGLLSGAVSLHAPSAEAGTYYVRSCFADGIEQVWSAYRSNGFADAYRHCPEGVVARNVLTTWPATGFSNAKLYDNAPPGTWIDEIHFEGSITTDRGWWAGLFDRQNGRWLWCGASCNSFGRWFPFSVDGFATSSLEAMVMCSAAQCQSDGREVGMVAMRNITLRLQDVWGPSVSIVGSSLAAGGWKRGVQTVEVEGGDNTGVRALRALVDGALHDERPMHCDEHLLVPCGSSARRVLAVDLSRVPAGAHDLEVQVVDASGNVSQTRRKVFVDNSPPDAVLSLTSSAEPWNAVNAFDVSWTNPRDDIGAPVAGVNYRFCPEGEDSAASCTPVENAQKRLATSLSGIAVPAPGAWRLQLWLVDEAENQNHQTAREVPLRWDPDPPTVKMLNRDENDPTRIRVRAGDAISGLAATEIELRRRGSSTWHSIAVERTEQGFTGVIDDEVFPRGTYAVRAARAITPAMSDRLRQLPCPSRCRSASRPSSPSVGRRWCGPASGIAGAAS